MNDEIDLIEVEIFPDPDLIEIEVPAEINVIEIEVPAEIDAVEIEIPGEMGARGPPGRDGNGSAATWDQTFPAATWIIPHTFGRPPIVQVQDETGEVIYPDIFPGITAVTLTFAKVQTGKVILF